MQTTAALIAVALALTAAAVSAQTKPDFSGRWTLDWSSIPIPPGASGPGTGPGRGAPRGGALGEEFTAIQNHTTLTIAYTDQHKPVTLVYRLVDAVWQADKLILTTPTRFGELKRSLSLDRGQLAIEIEQSIPEGGPIRSTIRYSKR